MDESQIPPQPPPTPTPFADQPIQPRGGGGCGKPVWIGCGIVFLLLGVAGLVFVMKAKNLLVWSLEKVRDGVLTGLPDDVTAEDRTRFDAAFAAAKARIESGQLDPAALQSLQAELMQSVQQPGGKLTREQFLELTESLEKLGGITPATAPEGESPPSPASDSPAPAPPPPAAADPAAPPVSTGP